MAARLVPIMQEDMYADDLLLLSPSRSSLQEMVGIDAKYAKEHRIEFSNGPKSEKSKTKGMVFSGITLNFTPAPIILNGDAIPWVSGNDQSQVDQ